MRNWINVGQLTKVISKSEGFAVKSAAGLSFLLHEDMQVFFVPPILDFPRSSKIKSACAIDNVTCKVVFEGLDSFETNVELVGSYVVISSEHVNECDLEKHPVLLTGFELLNTAHDYIGQVSSVEGSDTQFRLEVVEDNGNVFLLPLVDAFIVNIDLDAHQIICNVPESIRSLNAR